MRLVTYRTDGGPWRSGSGLTRVPPVRLKAGDTVEVEIGGLGVLSNPLVDP